MVNLKKAVLLLTVLSVIACRLTTLKNMKKTAHKTDCSIFGKGWTWNAEKKVCQSGPIPVTMKCDEGWVPTPQGGCSKSSSSSSSSSSSNCPAGMAKKSNGYCYSADSCQVNEIFVQGKCTKIGANGCPEGWTKSASGSCSWSSSSSGSSSSGSSTSGAACKSDEILVSGKCLKRQANGCPEGWTKTASGCSYSSLKCPEGFDLTADGKCWPKSDCPKGQIKVGGKCLVLGANGCPEGWTKNSSGGCTSPATVVESPCPSGYTRDEKTRYCFKRN